MQPELTPPQYDIPITSTQLDTSHTKRDTTIVPNTHHNLSKKYRMIPKINHD